MKRPHELEKLDASSSRIQVSGNWSGTRLDGVFAIWPELFKV